MENIQLKEEKLNKLRQSKYKSAYTKGLVLKSLKIGIIFAISMIIIRCLSLWILSLESEVPYKELITSRYYYGSSNFNLIKYIYFLINEILDFVVSDSLKVVVLEGGFSFFDWIFVVISFIYVLLLLIELFGLYIFLPLLYFIMKVICTIDSIIPLNFGIFYGWFLYLSVFGALGSFILMKKKKNNEINFEDGIKCKKTSDIIVELVVIISVIAFIGINFTGKIPKSDEFKNIRELMIITDEKS